MNVTRLPCAATPFSKGWGFCGLRGLCASLLCALCVEIASASTPAQVFLANLRQIADSGRFVYSWTNPWLPTDAAFRAPDGVGFAFVNLWGGYEIPSTEEGKECFKRFLERPEVITFRDGVSLADAPR